MTSRDDMVIVLNLGDPGQATAPVRAREERRMGQATRAKGGIFRKIRRAIGARKIAAATARRTGMGRAVKAASGAARGGAMAARGASLLNPVSALIAAGVIATMVTLRLVTGESFEGMGQTINNVLIGDLDEDARAKRDTRLQLGTNDNFLRQMGRQSKADTQTRKMIDDLVQIRKRRLLGEAALRTAIDVPGSTIWDQIILNAQRKWKEVWTSNNGPEKIEGIRLAYAELTDQANSTGGFR